MMDVKIADRQDKIEWLRMALNICELGVNYPQADLIYKLVDKLNASKGQFTLNDGSKVFSEWKQHWQKYFDDQKTSDE